MKQRENITHEECSKLMLPIKDALEVLHGKWKLPILISLLTGTKRFRQIARDVGGITDRMLSKELKELELNKLILRKVEATFPPQVEYTLTEHGRSLGSVINELREWGLKHRGEVMGV